MDNNVEIVINIIQCYFSLARKLLDSNQIIQCYLPFCRKQQITDVKYYLFTFNKETSILKIEILL